MTCNDLLDAIKVKLVKRVPSFPYPCIRDFDDILKVVGGRDSTTFVWFDRMIPQHMTAYHSYASLMVAAIQHDKVTSSSVV